MLTIKDTKNRLSLTGIPQTLLRLIVKNNSDTLVKPKSAQKLQSIEQRNRLRIFLKTYEVRQF